MKQALLGSLGDFKNGVNFQSGQMGSGLPLINVKDITDSRLIDSRNLNLVDVKIGDDMLAREGDIFFVRSSVKLSGIALAAMLKSSEQPAVHCGFVIRFRSTSPCVDPEFLLYLLGSPEYRERLKNLSGGAAIVNISQTALKSLEVSIPPIGTQQTIAELLSSYDDLIENNRRRMALLEESARQLYREWFVRLRFPGYEHTRIDNGAPQGWERKTLDELTSFLKRGITPNYDDDAEGLVINQKCIRGGRVNLELARNHSKEVKPERVLQLGDVLVNSTGEGTLGRVAQVKVSLVNCTVDTHVTIVRPNGNVGRHYFGQAVMEWEPRFSTMGKGATNQTELSPAAIGETAILMPSHALLGQFEQFAEPLYEQVSNLTSQNQRLRAARDLLLPRLMSGELAV